MKVVSLKYHNTLVNIYSKFHFGKLNYKDTLILFQQIDPRIDGFFVDNKFLLPYRVIIKIKTSREEYSIYFYKYENS